MLLKAPGAKWLVQRYFRSTRAMTLGVRALLIDPEGHVLLVRHGYAHGWHLPGGGVERGESVHEALTREIAEEAGATMTAPPVLHGLFTNFDAFPGDHVAVFVVREFTRTPPAPSLEIREQAFFAPDALPEGTTTGTARRIAEVIKGATVSTAW